MQKFKNFIENIFLRTRQYIAMYLVLVFGILSVIGFLKQKDLPSDFVTVVSMIIAFFFGRNEEKEIK